MRPIKICACIGQRRIYFKTFFFPERRYCINALCFCQEATRKMFVFFAKNLQFFHNRKTFPADTPGIDISISPLSFFLRNEKPQYTDQVQFR